VKRGVTLDKNSVISHVYRKGDGLLIWVVSLFTVQWCFISPDYPFIYWPNWVY